MYHTLAGSISNAVLKKLKFLKSNLKNHILKLLRDQALPVLSNLPAEQFDICERISYLYYYAAEDFQRYYMVDLSYEEIQRFAGTISRETLEMNIENSPEALWGLENSQSFCERLLNSQGESLKELLKRLNSNRPMETIKSTWCETIKRPYYLGNTKELQKQEKEINPEEEEEIQQKLKALDEDVEMESNSESKEEEEIESSESEEEENLDVPHLNVQENYNLRFQVHKANNAFHETIFKIEKDTKRFKYKLVEPDFRNDEWNENMRTYLTEFKFKNKAIYLKNQEDLRLAQDFKAIISKFRPNYSQFANPVAIKEIKWKMRKRFLTVDARNANVGNLNASKLNITLSNDAEVFVIEDNIKWQNLQLADPNPQVKETHRDLQYESWI
jgi:hypothetical protein